MRTARRRQGRSAQWGAGPRSTIEEILTSLGIGWGDVGPVVLTHQHGDHIGSAPTVARAAPDATFYGGAADVPAIDISRRVVALEDGDLDFETAYVGHGEPVLRGAAAQVRALG